MAGLPHTEGMTAENRRPGTAHLDKEKRVEIARKAALSRWGSEGRLTGDALKERNRENNRRWRAQKKLKKSLASSPDVRA